MKNIIARYEQVAGYKVKPFGSYKRTDKAQTVTDKQKSRDHGEVFTPLWLVDEMVSKGFEEHGEKHVWLDMCAGYGAFALRILMGLGSKHKGWNDKTPAAWSKKHLAFSEFQISSALKLLYIFGSDINLYIGDSLAMKKDMPEGIFIECSGKWYKISQPSVLKMHRWLMEDYDKGLAKGEKALELFRKKRM